MRVVSGGGRVSTAAEYRLSDHFGLLNRTAWLLSLFSDCLPAVQRSPNSETAARPVGGGGCGWCGWCGVEGYAVAAEGAMRLRTEVVRRRATTTTVATKASSDQMMRPTMPAPTPDAVVSAPSIAL